MRGRSIEQTLIACLKWEPQSRALSWVVTLFAYAFSKRNIVLLDRIGRV